MLTDHELDLQLAAGLRARGYRVTNPRLLVHRHVRRVGGHVTADDVGAGVPGLSAGTVYAALELLEELGVVRRVSTLAGPAVFDSRPDPHGHAVCRRCGRIVDVDAPSIGEPITAPSGFSVERTEVQLVGLCGDCAA